MPHVGRPNAAPAIRRVPGQTNEFVGVSLWLFPWALQDDRLGDTRSPVQDMRREFRNRYA